MQYSKTNRMRPNMRGSFHPRHIGDDDIKKKESFCYRGVHFCEIADREGTPPKMAKGNKLSHHITIWETNILIKKQIVIDEILKYCIPYTNIQWI